MEKKLDWSLLEQETPKWFRDAKFGLFFHWGVYSVPACENEWYSRNMYAKGLPQNLKHVEKYGKLKDFGYKDFIEMFKGEAFDAEAWAELVVRSGAKYAGPVTEHADNFSMWDSAVNPVNSMKMGPKKDVVGECEKAFRKKGIKYLATFHHQWLWGWFMSTDAEADVYDPENEKYYWKALPLETNRYMPYRYPDDKFNQMWLDKTKEVIDKYKPDTLYFDSRTMIIGEEYRYEMAEYYKEKVKDGVITYKQSDFPKDIGVYDIENGHFAEAKEFPWQTDNRLEDNITWCIVQEPKYKSATSMVHLLCDVVAKNGNLLLNVGPNADGSFPEEAVKELYAVGDWLKVNGEAIYESRPYEIAAEGPTTSEDEDYDTEKIKKQIAEGIATDIREKEFSHEDFRFTQKGDTIYAIALDWPKDNSLQVKTLGYGKRQKKITSVQMLGENSELSFKQSEELLFVELPATKPCEHAYVLKIQ